MYERVAVHLGLTAIMGWLGLYLELGRHVFSQNEDFAYMASFASEHTWAIVFFAIANVGVVGLITSNTVLCLLSVLIVATGHGVFAGSLIMSDGSVWSGTYAIIAALGYYLAFQRAHAGL